MGVRSITISNERVSATVSAAHGARLTSLRIDGVEVLVTRGNDPLAWGCYPMVPYAGRVRDALLRFDGREHDLRPNGGRHSLHGTVFDVPWETVSVTATSATFTTTLGDDWPFSATVIHHIETDSDGVTMRLVLHCDEPQPVQVGWHPWFLKPRVFEHRCALMLPRDLDGIATSPAEPIGAPPWDDCFVSDGATPSLEVSGVSLRLSSDCSHWVVYDEPRHATCVEPQSGPPNGINDAPLVLGAGEMMTRWFRIERL